MERHFEVKITTEQNCMCNKAPVMILFFNRPDNLRQVFEAVREYRPNELFLVQDGARDNRPDDIDKIMKCREIVSVIDWNCNVHQNYSDENLSCDPREYTGISWCFEYVDRLIILEDDCVPTEGFFKLCEECLEKYYNNTNIHSIYGFNRVGEYDCPYDYLFSMTSAGWGWATWKRVWDIIEMNRPLSFFDNKVDTQYLNAYVDKSIKNIYGDFIKYMLETRKNDKQQHTTTSWEKLVGFPIIAYNMLTIVPKNNLIKYIGISEDATHTNSNPKLLPQKIRRVLTQPAFSIDGDIKHPPFIVRDVVFEKKSNATLKIPRIVAKFEVAMRKVVYSIVK